MSYLGFINCFKEFFFKTIKKCNTIINTCFIYIYNFNLKKKLKLTKIMLLKLSRFIFQIKRYYQFMTFSRIFIRILFLILLYAKICISITNYYFLLIVPTINFVFFFLTISITEDYIFNTFLLKFIFEKYALQSKLQEELFLLDLHIQIINVRLFYLSCLMLFFTCSYFEDLFWNFLNLHKVYLYKKK